MDSWKKSRGGSAALEHVPEETAISTLGNFQELASWPQLVGASVGDTHSIRQENGLNDLHRSL